MRTRVFIFWFTDFNGLAQKLERSENHIKLNTFKMDFLNEARYGSTQEEEEDLEELQQQQSQDQQEDQHQLIVLNVNDYENLLGRKILATIGETGWAYGRILSVNESDIFEVIFENERIPYSRYYTLVEILEFLIPLNAPESNTIFGPKGIWSKIFKKYNYIRQMLEDQNTRTFTEKCLELNVIKELFNFKTAAINVQTVKRSRNAILKQFAQDKTTNHPKRIKYVEHMVCMTIRYIFEAYQHQQEQTDIVQDEPQLQYYPEYGSAEFLEFARLRPGEETFTQPSNTQPNNQHASQDNGQRDLDEDDRDNTIDDPYGKDIPFEATDGFARHIDGKLIDDYNAVDALHLNTALASPFKHHEIVPKKAMSAWRQCYIVIASALIQAMNIPPSTPGRFLALRRAFIYYAILPQLVLRNTSQTTNHGRITKDVLKRCNQLLNKEFGTLLNEWDTDYKKIADKSRTMSKDTPEKRAKQTVKDILAGKSRAITRGVNRLLSNGRTSCDNQRVREQMLAKHPQSEEKVHPHEEADDESDRIPMTELKSIIDGLDLATSAASRGVHPHYIFCLSRAKNLYPGSESEGIDVYTKLGQLILENKRAWVSLALGGTVLTPLLKNSQLEEVNLDARPLAAKDCDNSIWLKAAQHAQTERVCKLVIPQQLSIGISGGATVKVIGCKLQLEKANDEGKGVTYHKEDIDNAYNGYDRVRVMRDISDAAAVRQDLVSFERLARNTMILEPVIRVRTTRRGDGYDELCNSESGGEQGNATTGLIFACGMNAPMKQTEENFGVMIRAIADDTTIMGDAGEIYGGGKALEFFIKESETRGMIMKPAKACAYANTEAQRLLIPAHVKQPFYTVKDNEGEERKVFGFEDCGAPIGDDGYVREWLRRKGDEIAGKIDFISETISNINLHSSIAITIRSLQCSSDYILSTNLPTQTAEYVQIVNAAMQRAYKRGYQSDLLAPDETLPDPMFTHDRAKLRCGTGGAGIYQLGDRHPFLNTLVNVLPQLIDRKDAKGGVTQGLFNCLAPLLGEGSFDETNAANYWSVFMASGSRYADEMVADFERGKLINENLVASITAYQHPQAPPASVFDSPMDSLCAGPHKKLSKLITDERAILKFENMKERAGKLPVTDNRRSAFYANSLNQLANKLLGTSPHPEVKFTNDEISTSTAVHFGLKIPILMSHVGNIIQNHPNCPKLSVDAYGINLSKVTGCKGGETQHNHNAVVSFISQSFSAAGIPQIGGLNSQSCKNIFSSAIPRHGISTNDTASTKNIKSIIADLVVNAQNVTDNRPLGGYRHIIDAKTLAGSYVYQQSNTNFGYAVDKRGAEVNNEYHNTASNLDSKLHGTPPGLKGPFAKVLAEYGKDERVLGPTVGFYGEGSRDLLDLCNLAAKEMAKRHTEYYHCTVEQAYGLHKHILSRKWGHSIARGWAQLIISRLRNSAIPYNSQSDFGDSDAHAQFEYFNPGNGAGNPFNNTPCD